MWNKINSPIVICLIVIVALLAFRASIKPKLATEIRGMYEELMTIAEEGANDAEKNKAIQKFAQEISKQIKMGFAQGFKSDTGNKTTIDKDLQFIELKKKIKISDIKFVPAKWQGREQFIFKIKNGTDKYIKSLKLNYEFYKNDELIDLSNDWASEIKILEPNQEFAMSKERQFPSGTKKENEHLYKSDSIKVIITSFDVKDVKLGRD